MKQQQQHNPILINFIPGVNRCSTFLRNWLCGTVDRAQDHITAEEKAEIRKKMTSIEQDSKWARVLNILAIILATLTAFLLGYFG